MRTTVGALALAFLVGCGGTGERGRATLWVTRDRGAHVLLVARVPAGLTAIQALERKAHVETSYGGRFVQAIDGVAGDASAQRDWFYFVNGYEADRGAAEYRLHAGDVEWWDYRSWRHAAHVPVVVGAFPEPFLHGYDGKRRRAVVFVHGRSAAAARVARRLHAKLEEPGRTAPSTWNALALVISPTRRRFEARLAQGASSPGAPVRILFRGDPRDLLSRRFRFRYSVP